jgi:iron(III) transport system ATP-binding protein
MGEAMLFPATVVGGRVNLGPLSFAPRLPMSDGPVKVAVRPEAWQVRQVLPSQPEFLHEQGIAGILRKSAYLGSFYEYTFETELGLIFVVSPDVAVVLAPGTAVQLLLAGHGVSVVATQ